MLRIFRPGAFLLAVLGISTGLATAADATTWKDAVAAYGKGSYEQARKLMLPLAKDGHAEAQFYVGYMIESGLGGTADRAEAVSWYRLAADQEVARAQFNLGLSYLHGLGVDQDVASAQEWFLRAAEQGHVRSQYKVAEMYENGQGTDANLIEAYRWFSLAARKRFEDSKKRRKQLAKKMDPYDVAKAEMLARHWRQARQ